MAGERILVVDDSVGTQEIARNILEDAGYKVTVAANGVAALYYVQENPVDLIILDNDMLDLSGPETSRLLKTDAGTNRIPLLLLVPEERAEERGSQSLYGANAFLLKPFSPKLLKARVEALLEEKDIYEQAKFHLQQAAEKFMEKTAEQHIQSALEKKIQLIVERAQQHIVSLIDQYARREVEQRITSLTTEKEQELVRQTVREVAHSMIERLAEKKVADAMETILAEQTDRRVREIGESLLPTMVRERLRESMEKVLPREAETQVKKAAEDAVPAVSNKIVATVDGIAQRVIPKVARDRLPEIIERQLNTVATTLLPKTIREIASSEVDSVISERIEPVVERSLRRIKTKVNMIGLLILLVVLLGIAFNVMDRFFPQIFSGP